MVSDRWPADEDNFYEGGDPEAGACEDAQRGDDDEGAGTALPPRIELWRRRSATGAVLTGIALGLREALGQVQQPPAAVAEAPGEPPGPPEPVEFELDPDSPEHSRIVVRPWLL